VLIFDTSTSAIRKATVATISGSGATTVSISANDTTPAVLATKLVAGTGVTLTENNDGANETLTVATIRANPCRRRRRNPSLPHDDPFRRLTI
jgi:hypothetical protein